jgi:hypothetical protein
MRENSVRPCTHCTGRESRTASGYAWKWPAAQYGLQSFACPTPLADAAVALQLLQCNVVA